MAVAAIWKIKKSQYLSFGLTSFEKKIGMVMPTASAYKI